MTPDAAAHCRDVLDRLRAQVVAHLPALTGTGYTPDPAAVVPLDRLPMLGQVAQQYVEAEAVFASANAAPAEGG